MVSRVVERGCGVGGPSHSPWGSATSLEAPEEARFYGFSYKGRRQSFTNTELSGLRQGQTECVRYLRLS